MSQTKAQLVSGTSAQDLTVDNINTSSVNSTQISGRKNVIINGAMQVNQRASSYAWASGGTLSGYTLDRFRFDLFPFGGTSATATVTQSTTAPDGFTNSLKVDVTATDTSLVGNNYSQLSYQAERQDIRHFAYGTSAAKSITLSFYVRSNKTGNYNVNILQYGSSTRLASFTYAISSADTWERKTITIAGDTGGNVVDGNTAGLNINFGLAYGGNYITGSNQNSFGSYVAANSGVGQDVNLYDSTSNEWYITGVQLEVGSTATDFEHRGFGEEYALCQRYYQRSYSYGTAIGATTSVGAVMHSCSVTQTYASPGSIKFPVNMRAIPTITIYSAQTGTAGKINSDSTDGNGTAFGTNETGTMFTRSNDSSGVGVNAFVRVHYVADAEL